MKKRNFNNDICKWVQPEGDLFFNFWISPATLAFSDVSELHIVVEAFEPGMTVIDVEKTAVEQVEPAALPSRLWGVHLLNGNYDFKSKGFTLYMRSDPLPRRAQKLTVEERGGFSFDRSCPK
jgi:hypothetical protein